MRVLITGMSGSGKSTLVRELSGRGLAAFDADDDGFTEPRSGGRWGWNMHRVAALLAEYADGGLLFFAGCSDEQGELAFDLRVLLTAPTGVLLDRLRSRTTNDYGKTPEEVDLIMADLELVEPLLRRTADLVLDTEAPVEHLADRILDLAHRAPAELQLERLPTADPFSQPGLELLEPPDFEDETEPEPLGHWR